MKILPWAAALLCASSAWGDPPPTPASLPGAEAHVYRALSPVPLRLFVFKPVDWKPADRRPALVWFFGGGWATGTPDHAAAWTRWAAGQGLVGVAPDYRVRDRFGGTPLDAVADARAAVRWVEDHAAELGVDAREVAVGGNSSGGHLALWTAIRHAPPGSLPAESPRIKPAALILTSPVSDTSPESGYTPQRFGPDARALSPVDQLDASMPPVLIFHGDADETVPCQESIVLRNRLLAGRNDCQLVLIPGGGHDYVATTRGGWPQTLRIARGFLVEFGLLSPEQ